MLTEGTLAPNFTLMNVSGEQISLTDFLGKTVVVYFYPKDDTPGCTKEACSFRDWYDTLIEKGVVVIGISPDNQASHQKFKEKYNLPFYLVSDEDHQVAELYGAWGEKSMYGKKYFGIIRSTFVIDAEGKLQKVFKKVQTEKHAEEILEILG